MSTTSSRDEPVRSTRTRQEWKHKKTALQKESYGKERLEDYSASVAQFSVKINYM